MHCNYAASNVHPSPSISSHGIDNCGKICHCRPLKSIAGAMVPCSHVILAQHSKATQVIAIRHHMNCLNFTRSHTYGKPATTRSTHSLLSISSTSHLQHQFVIRFSGMVENQQHCAQNHPGKEPCTRQTLKKPCKNREQDARETEVESLNGGVPWLGTESGEELRINLLWLLRLWVGSEGM